MSAKDPKTELPPGPSPTPGKPGGDPNDPLEPFNSRLPRSLQKRLKVHVALHDTKIQDVLGAALDDYLNRHGS